MIPPAPSAQPIREKMNDYILWSGSELCSSQDSVESHLDFETVYIKQVFKPENRVLFTYKTNSVTRFRLLAN